MMNLQDGGMEIFRDEDLGEKGGVIRNILANHCEEQM